MFAARSFLLLSLIALVLGKPMARNMKLHESREGIPDGFSLRGAAQPDWTLKLRLALVQSNLAELERKLMDVSTPSSANYGKHLSKAEVCSTCFRRNSWVLTADTAPTEPRSSSSFPRRRTASTPSTLG